MTNKIISSIILFFLASFLTTKAASNADNLMKLGKYAEAAALYAKAADSSPSDALAATKAAEAFLWARNASNADAYAKNAGHHQLYLDAVKHLINYNFDAAEESLEKYTSGKNAKAANHQLIENIENKIEKTRSLLERVEKIVVVDSIQVPKKEFFKNYMLSKFTGTLVSPSELPQGFKAQAGTAVFRTQLGDKMMWGAPIGKNKVQIVQSDLLADGTWEKPQTVEGAINSSNATEVNFPYMLADGVTMYFASNDPETSIGGLDIYITRFDGEKFLEPQNLGMPYNSEYNDYMFVIDEMSGAGWWATDRNAKPDMVTIYMFKPTELRVNYPVDTPNLTHLAKLDNIALTIPQNFDTHSFIQNIKTAVLQNFDSKIPEFEFALPDGRVITSSDQLKNPEAAEALANFLDYRAQYHDTISDLIKMRKQYANGDTSQSEDILQIENKLPQMRRELLRLSNMVVSAETSK